MEKIGREFITSLITVILAILAVAVYIYFGANLLFYSAMAIALVFGFYNAWLISSLEASIESGSGKKATPRKRR